MMNPRRSLTGAAVVFLAAVSSGSGQEPTGIGRAAWLQGCWEMTTGPRSIEEQWMAPRGTSMVGMSRTVRDGRLVEFELVVLREQGAQLAYDAHPSGQAGAVFLSRIVSESTLVFENPKHDFPHTIGYQRRGPDVLLAWIEGTQAGQTRRVDFSYHRATCPGQR
jgi:hypothetical protein